VDLLGDRRHEGDPFWSGHYIIVDTKWSVNSKTGIVIHMALTAKGRATRERIVTAAAVLMRRDGVARTTIEDIQLAAGVSASQLYHYFLDKNALVLAVIEQTSDAVLGVQHEKLDEMTCLADLEAWRDHVVGIVRRLRCVGGCPLGSLASDLAESDPIARTQLARSFAEWETVLRHGIATMRDTGEIRADADPDELALAMLTAIQGGLLLSQVRRSTKPLEVGIDAMIAHLRVQAA
jgi:TetR/AcrR family transcriptional repressor of nem operon